MSFCFISCFCMWCRRNSWKILTTNQFSVSTIFFRDINISFFNLYSVFSINKKVNQISLCYNSPCFCVLLCTHNRPLQCFSTYFHKSKEIRVLGLIFPNYVISCGYAFTMMDSTAHNVGVWTC